MVQSSYIVFWVKTNHVFCVITFSKSLNNSEIHIYVHSSYYENNE